MGPLALANSALPAWAVSVAPVLLLIGTGRLLLPMARAASSVRLPLPMAML